MTTQQQAHDFMPVARVDDVRPGEGKLVRPGGGKYRGKPIALFNDNGTFYAMNYICPHAGGPIGEGTIEDGVVTCPLHAWAYHAGTGLPHGSNDHIIAVYEVKVEGETVLVGPQKTLSTQ